MKSLQILGGIALILATFSVSASAQIVGNGCLTNTTTSYPAPYGNYWWGARQQYVIPASELLAAGIAPTTISSLSFDVTNVNTSPALTNWTVSIGHTTATDASAWQTGLTVVHTTASYLPVAGWNTHAFSAGTFAWDGVQNIVVETCFNNASFVTNASCRQNATTYISTRLYRADAAGVCGNAGLTSTHLQRPNIVFNGIFPSGTEFQINQPAATLLVNGATGCPSAPVVVTQTAPATGTIALTSNQLSQPWDLAINSVNPSLVGLTMGGLGLPDGQVVNVQLPGLTLINNFLGANWPGLLIPGATGATLSVPYSVAIGPTSNGCQAIWVNPTSPTGISLSQATQLTIN